MKPIFGLDIDGCPPYDFDFAAREAYKAMGYEDPGPSEEWDDLEKKNPEAWQRLWTEGIEKHKLFRNKDAVGIESLRLVHALKSQGWEVVFVTCRPAEAHEDTLWLAEQIGVEKVMHFERPEDKVEADVDVLLDDAPPAVAECLAAGKPVICYHQPWNADLEVPVRCATVETVVSYAQRCIASLAHFNPRTDDCEVTQEIPVVAFDHEADEPVSSAVVKLADNPEAQDGPSARAIELVYGDREEAYGHPFDDFSRTAAMWTALFADILVPGAEFEAEDVPLVMACIKLSRERNESKPDNSVDLCGYAETLYRVKQERERRRVGA